MKTLFTTLLFTALFSFTTTGQISMPLGNASWKYKSMSDVMVVTYYYYHSQDTAQYTFTGNDYYKVTYETSATSTTNHNKFFLRNDTAAQQVLLYDSITNAEYVLYDFSVMAGETVKNLYNQMVPFADSARVDSVVARIINGVSRKHVYTKSLGNSWSWSYTKVWIEGIGSTYELMSPSGHNPFNGFDLICFNANGQILYGDSTTCSNGPIGLDEVQKTRAKVYPNPVSDIINVALDKKFIGTIAIYDIVGKEIINSKVENGNYFSLDISKQKPGLYLLIIEDKFNTVLSRATFLKE